jgi:hypothetical protein
MLDFWRLDYENGDFILIESPVFLISNKVRAYHVELLNRVKSLPYYYLPSSDTLLFENLYPYYKNLGDLLKIDIDNLVPEARHSFFIASEQKGNNWLSGLEKIMGYDFVETKQDSEDIIVSSGNFEIDILAELLLLPDTRHIEWLCKSKSPIYLSKLIKQISDRSRGEEHINELKTKRDLEFLNNPETLEKLQKKGINI